MEERGGGVSVTFFVAMGLGGVAMGVGVATGLIVVTMSGEIVTFWMLILLKLLMFIPLVGTALSSVE